MEITSMISSTCLLVNGQFQQRQEQFLQREIKRLPLNNAYDAVIAQAAVRDLASTQGYSVLDRVCLSTAISEIARDLVVYAGQGEIVVLWYEDNAPRKGLIFFCHDRGLNEPRLAAKFQTGGNDTNSKLNFLGLRKLVDQFEFRTDPEYGNCVIVVKWLER